MLAARVWVFAALALSAPGPARVQAQAQASPKVLLVDQLEPDDGELAARIAGQTRDLPLQLEAASNREPDFDQAGAQALADRQRAAAVVWIARRQDGGLQVHVLDALRRNQRMRELDPQPAANDQLAASALYEAAALVVRGELSNLLEQENLAARAAEAEAARATGGSDSGTGGSGGTAVGPNPDRDGDGKPDATDEDDDGDGEPDDVDDDGLSAGPTRGARGLWTLRAGARVARVSSEHAAFGPLLGFGVDIGHATLTLQGTTSWPLTISGDGVEVELRRHGLTLHPLVQLTDSRQWRLLAGIDGGMVLYARRTPSASGTLSATPPTTSLSAVFGADAELQWWPTRWFSLTLAAGLDLLTGPTKFALQRGTGPQVVQRLAWFEPWAALSFNVTP